ncbi:amidase [Pseudarthrobacter sp. lyk4-40-TYG-27]|uniref:amidase n=1 Tax=Pseudarthrobacter sp. lyk4-40-TYG-27 TaxID=3040305 RepID=UPI00255564F8|nr:amidase [Pseudarthrobacter sp. lyk4-40-TYG-27]
MGLRDLSAALHEGLITPTRAVEAVLQRIEETEPSINAWVHVDAEGALATARRLEESADPRGPLWGVPVAVKDLIDVAGMPTRCGSSLRDDTPAPRDAECVRLLREAGAVVIGKTVTTEFGYFKPGPTRNPANLAHTPGGSSSGSAAAVAADVVPLALGTQTAGSLTRPAAFCCAAGFVTPTGTFSLEGVTGLSHSLDTLGFLAPHVADLHLVWDILTHQPAKVLQAGTDEPVRILLWNGSGLGDVSPAMDAAVGFAADTLIAGGAAVNDWQQHDLIQQLCEAHADVMAYEAAEERAAELERTSELSPPLVELLTTGQRCTPEEYAAAQQTIASLRQEVLSLLATHDAVLGPAALGAAPAGIEATGSPVLSRPWQALGFAAITIPGLRDEFGMPLGIQLIGIPGQEERLFTIAEQVEETIAARTPTFPTARYKPCPQHT